MKTFFSGSMDLVHARLKRSHFHLLFPLDIMLLVLLSFTFSRLSCWYKPIKVLCRKFAGVGERSGLDGGLVFDDEICGVLLLTFWNQIT